MNAPLDRSTLSRSVYSGALRSFGDVPAECHRTDTGQRFMTYRAAARVFNGTDSPHFGRLVRRLPNKPDGFSMVPIPFLLPNGRVGHGLTPAQIVGFLVLYLQAADQGLLSAHHDAMVARCRRISYALMGTALTKLIDDAVGYRDSGPVDQRYLARLESDNLTLRGELVRARDDVRAADARVAAQREATAALTLPPCTLEVVVGEHWAALHIDARLRELSRRAARGSKRRGWRSYHRAFSNRLRNRTGFDGPGTKWKNYPKVAERVSCLVCELDAIEAEVVRDVPASMLRELERAEMPLFNRGAIKKGA